MAQTKRRDSIADIYRGRSLLSVLLSSLSYVLLLSVFFLSPHSAISEVKSGANLLYQEERADLPMPHEMCSRLDKRVRCKHWQDFKDTPLVIPSAVFLEKRAEVLKGLWVGAWNINQNTHLYLDFLKHLEEDALDPEEYALGKLASLVESGSENELSQISELCTRSLIKLLSDLHWGRRRYRLRDYPKLEQEIEANSEGYKKVLEYHLDQALRSKSLVDYLRQQLPDVSQYLELKRHLSLFKRIALLQKTDTYSPDLGGEQDSKASQESHLFNNYGVILKALVNFGELSVANAQKVYKELQTMTSASTARKSALAPAKGISPPLYVEAIRRFQSRTGLNTDGIVGEETLRELLRPIADRINTIAINLERWRWLPHSSDDSFWDTFIMVNTAGFELVFVRERKLIDRMPVIVGTRYNRTPTFSASVEAIEFNPFWNVPSSIASKELWPKERRAPGTLERQHIRILSGGRLRQDPGPGNALGRIKFVLPNNFNVYLHDTPTKHLFNHDSRAFSHGCIRVSRPEDLALEILNYKQKTWTRDRIDSALKEGENRRVYLPQEIPIHIIYRTAWVEGDGQIYFRPDIYQRDQLPF